jgi:hypothetical protein
MALNYWRQLQESFVSSQNGLLPKSLFACSETSFDESKACFRRCQNSPFGLLTVDIAYLPLRQDLLSKIVLMTAQMGFPLGNSL